MVMCNRMVNEMSTREKIQGYSENRRIELTQHNGSSSHIITRWVINMFSTERMSTERRTVVNRQWRSGAVCKREGNDLRDCRPKEVDRRAAVNDSQCLAVLRASDEQFYKQTTKLALEGRTGRMLNEKTDRNGVS